MKRLTYLEPKRRGRRLGWIVASYMAFLQAISDTF